MDKTTAIKTIINYFCMNGKSNPPEHSPLESKKNRFSPDKKSFKQLTIQFKFDED